MSLILGMSSETTDVATTFAPPNFSDEEFTTETARGPLQICKCYNRLANSYVMMRSLQLQV